MTDATSSPKRVTSQALTKKQVRACWGLGLVASGAGGAATFMSGNQAGSAALVALGIGLLFMALTERVPLQLEVGTTKLDASYLDEAFEEGRSQGHQQGVATAAKEIEEGLAAEVPPDQLLERLRQEAQMPPLQPEPTITRGYGPQTAASVSGITHRQLDYWARTGLVEPTFATDQGVMFSDDDLVLLTVVKRLLDAGVSLANIRTAITSVRRLELNDLAGLTLVSDGTKVAVVRDGEALRDIVSRGRAFFAISLGPIAEHVSDETWDRPGRPGTPLRASDDPPE